MNYEDGRSEKHSSLERSTDADLPLCGRQQAGTTITPTADLQWKSKTTTMMRVTTTTSEHHSCIKQQSKLITKSVFHASCQQHTEVKINTTTAYYQYGKHGCLF